MSVRISYVLQQLCQRIFVICRRNQILMKNYILPLIAFAMVFAGCDQLKDKNFDATYAKNLTIDIDENNGEGTFDLQEILNALSNENLEQVQDKIKSYDIRELSYKIWEYDGPAESLLNAEMKMLSSTGEVLFSITLDPELLQVLNSDDSYRTIPMTATEEEAIVTELLKENSVTIQAVGSVSEVPVHFVLQLVADITATAEVED